MKFRLVQQILNMLIPVQRAIPVDDDDDVEKVETRTIHFIPKLNKFWCILLPVVPSCWFSNCVPYHYFRASWSLSSSSQSWIFSSLCATPVDDVTCNQQLVTRKIHPSVGESVNATGGGNWISCQVIAHANAYKRLSAITRLSANFTCGLICDLVMLWYVWLSWVR